jgi:hypothetical protein
VGTRLFDLTGHRFCVILAFLCIYSWHGPLALLYCTSYHTRASSLSSVLLLMLLLLLLLLMMMMMTMVIFV